jgi:hypothetical protein
MHSSFLTWVPYAPPISSSLIWSPWCLAKSTNCETHFAVFFILLPHPPS